MAAEVRRHGRKNEPRCGSVWLTQNSVQAVNNCEQLAYEYGNQEIGQEHLLYSLLTLDDSLIAKLIEKMGIDPKEFTNRSKQLIEGLVKVQGGNGQIYVSGDCNRVLIGAESEAKALGDEYVSVEHLFLSLIKNANGNIKNLFREYGINRDTFLKALQSVRGNQRVTSDNPEATYDTLSKYGEELVQTDRRARRRQDGGRRGSRGAHHEGRCAGQSEE